jgi:hypothetical protein
VAKQNRHTIGAKREWTCPPLVLAEIFQTPTPKGMTPFPPPLPLFGSQSNARFYMTTRKGVEGKAWKPKAVKCEGFVGEGGLQETTIVQSQNESPLEQSRPKKLGEGDNLLSSLSTAPRLVSDLGRSTLVVQ